MVAEQGTQADYEQWSHNTGKAKVPDDTGGQRVSNGWSRAWPLRRFGASLPCRRGK